MENGGLSASDVALMSNDGFGGNGFMWIFGLLILLGMFNGGFGGYGNNAAAAAIGYENLATSNEVQRGFDNQNSMANQRDILAAVNSGTAQSVAATNQVYHDVVSYVGDKYSELARDVYGVNLAVQQAIANQNDCCSAQKQLIMQNNYDSAMRDAATNANFTAQIQSVKDMIAQDKIESLQNQVNQLNLQNQLAGVVKYPMNTMYGIPSPCFNGCGCGCTV